MFGYKHEACSASKTHLPATLTQKVSYLKKSIDYELFILLIQVMAEVVKLHSEHLLCHVCEWFMKLILKPQPRVFPLGPSVVLWITQDPLLLQRILQSPPQNADKYGIFGQKYLENT